MELGLTAMWYPEADIDTEGGLREACRVLAEFKVCVRSIRRAHKAGFADIADGPSITDAIDDLHERSSEIYSVLSEMAEEDERIENICGPFCDDVPGLLETMRECYAEILDEEETSKETRNAMRAACAELVECLRCIEV